MRRKGRDQHLRYGARPPCLRLASNPCSTTTATDTVLAVGTFGDAGAVTYTSDAPSVCTAAPISGRLSFATFGDCVIVATQAADALDGYAPSTAATIITVSLPGLPPFFTQHSGAATDLALGANGSLWALGTGIVPGGRAIFRWTGTSWARVVGGAVTIAVGPGNNPWTINSAHQIYRWNGTNWTRYPGAATDIAVGANGSVWTVGTNAVGGGYGIYEWNGSSWSRVAGGAVTIADGPGTNPWTVNSAHQIYRWNGTNWTRYPGTATDIGVGGTARYGVPARTPSQADTGSMNGTAATGPKSPAGRSPSRSGRTATLGSPLRATRSTPTNPPLTRPQLDVVH